jgi:ribonuclease HI
MVMGLVQEIPGRVGGGSIVIFDHKVLELGGGEVSTTNNRMEMMAILKALQFCLSHNNIQNLQKILILTDSIYLIRAMTQWIFGWKRRGWKTADNSEVSNQDLLQALDQVIYKIKSLNSKIELDWNFVKGHAGVPGNERCDQIAVAFSKNNYVELYKGLAQNYIFDPFVIPELKPLPEMKKKTDTEKKAAWYISLVNGVFSKHQTWKECEALVKGRAAKFKKVTSVDEEAEVKKGWGLSE